MENYQFAWTMYIVGALGCGLAAWLLFRRFGTVWSHFFAVTVLVLFLTPYAVDSGKMIMAPAIFAIVIEGFTGGLETVMPIILVMASVWLIALILALLLQLLYRRFFASRVEHYVSPSYVPPSHVQSRYEQDDELTEEEQDAHDELQGEEIRAVR